MFDLWGHPHQTRSEVKASFAVKVKLGLVGSIGRLMHQAAADRHGDCLIRCADAQYRLMAFVRR